VSTHSDLSRREFLQTAAGAGLVLAIHLPPPLRRDVRADSADPFAPNAWLAIAPDGTVTVTMDRSEMGQGAPTALAMLVAEELEADWATVRLGTTVENPAAWSRRMLTGGSSSVRTSYEPLRKAGAAAREMLVAAAAAQWGVEPATCQARQGTVVHTATGRSLPYKALVAKAATLPVPANPTLKPPAEFRYLGKRVKRLDTPLKIDGSAVFGLDVQVPGMLVASIQRCPVIGGKVKRYDAAKAKALPGVRHVVELPEIPGTGGGFFPTRTAAGVAVVADTYWQALQGRRALEVEWDEGPNAGLSSAGISALFAQLAVQPGVVARKEGEPDAALGAAAKKIAAVYEVPFLYHATMEPMNATAHVRSDGCDVWAPTQNQTGAQAVAAQYAGVPIEQVRVHTTFLGGGFGRRAETDFVAEAVQLSKAVGAPVKVIWSREDDVQHGFYRPASYHAFAAGVDAAGAPTAWTHRIVAPAILARFGPLQDGIDRTTVEGAANLPYGFPNLRVEQTVADLPVPLGFWRSVGSSHNAFVTESFVDEVAVAAGKDPFELRRALLAAQPRHRAVLELAAQKAGWGTPAPAGRGRGIALAESFGSIVAEVAEVSLESDGQVRVHRVVCAVDCGPIVNPDTIEAQMQSGVVYGLTAALYGAITIDKGRVQQSNFNDYPMLRLREMPAVETYIVPSDAKQGGMGEPGTPPIAPAVCNAIFALTGKRIRKLPIGTIA